MTEANSRSITTNQQGLNDKLEEVVLKHLNSDFKKPIAEHTQTAFEEVHKKVMSFNGPVVLDSCCGVGESTANLAAKHPEALVIGVDKSAHRIDKHDVEYKQTEHGQYLLVRADLNDFWRLIVEHKWSVSHHYLLYPNPWPKYKHLSRRWHGAPVFPFILKIGGRFELRSNWQTYVEEFAVALTIADKPAVAESYDADTSITPFERKYWASGQKSWRLVLAL